MVYIPSGQTGDSAYISNWGDFYIQPFDSGLYDAPGVSNNDLVAFDEWFLIKTSGIITTDLSSDGRVQILLDDAPVGGFFYVDSVKLYSREIDDLTMIQAGSPLLISADVTSSSSMSRVEFFQRDIPIGYGELDANGDWVCEATALAPVRFQPDLGAGAIIGGSVLNGDFEIATDVNTYGYDINWIKWLESYAPSGWIIRSFPGNDLPPGSTGSQCISIENNAPAKWPSASDKEGNVSSTIRFWFLNWIVKRNILIPKTHYVIKFKAKKLSGNGHLEVGSGYYSWVYAYDEDNVGFHRDVEVYRDGVFQTSGMIENDNVWSEYEVRGYASTYRNKGVRDLVFGVDQRDSEWLVDDVELKFDIGGVSTGLNDFTALVINTDGDATEIAPFSIQSSGFFCSVNFQTRDTYSSAGMPVDYEADVGLAFGLRGSGIHYGWRRQNDEVLDFSAGASSNVTLNETGLLLRDEAGYENIWEIEVPPGRYSVTIPYSTDFLDDHNFGELSIEGQSYGYDQFDDTDGLVAIVDVVDGKLTLAPGETGMPAVWSLSVCQLFESQDSLHYIRGSGFLQSKNSFIVPLDGQTGIAPIVEEETSNSGYFHYSAVTRDHDIPSDGPIAFFGQLFGASPLYTENYYSFGLHTGEIRNVVETTSTNTYGEKAIWRPANSLNINNCLAFIPQGAEPLSVTVLNRTRYNWEYFIKYRVPTVEYYISDFGFKITVIDRETQEIAGNILVDEFLSGPEYEFDSEGNNHKFWVDWRDALISGNSIEVNVPDWDLYTRIKVMPPHEWGGSNKNISGGGTGTQNDTEFTQFLVLDHKATSDRYLYIVSARGWFQEWDTHEWYSAMVYRDENGVEEAVHNPLYAFSFSDRPHWYGVGVKPVFSQVPMPPHYQGLSQDELNSFVGFQFDSDGEYMLQYQNASSVSLDTQNDIDNLKSYLHDLDGASNAKLASSLFESPELRRHPVLDQFIEDNECDPLVLANFVQNNIGLSDYLSWGDQVEDDFNRASVSIGGLRQNAVTTYLYGSGSPVDQCALMVYILRYCGIPCGYVFPEKDSLFLSVDQFSNLVVTQLENTARTTSMIPINYPWVVAYIESEGRLVHLFPWLKDIEVIEGYDLYDKMPDEYSNASEWLYDFVHSAPGENGNLGVMQSEDGSYNKSLGLGYDQPLVLWPKFLEQKLAEEDSSISLDDIGNIVRNRSHFYEDWSAFPQPLSIEKISTLYESLKELGYEAFDTINIQFRDQEDVEDTNDAQHVYLEVGELPICDLLNRTIYFEYVGDELTCILGDFLPFYESGDAPDLSYYAGHYSNYTGFSTPESLPVAKTKPSTDREWSWDDGSEFDAADVFDSWSKRHLATVTVEDDSTIYLSVIERRDQRNASALRLNNYTDAFYDQNFWNSFLFSQSTSAELQDRGRLFRNGWGYTPGYYSLVFRNGLVGREMVDSRFKEFDRFQASSSLDYDTAPKDVSYGMKLHLQGLRYFQYESEFDILNRIYHKVNLISFTGQATFGLKLNSESDPVWPEVNIFSYGLGVSSNGTSRPDLLTTRTHAMRDFFIMNAAQGSAAEHYILREFWNTEYSYSTMRLLQLAEQYKRAGNGSGIQILDADNWGSIGSQYNLDTSPLWPHVSAIFASDPWSDYAVTYSTPGNINAGNGIYASGLAPISYSGAFGGYITSPVNVDIAKGGLTPEQLEYLEVVDGVTVNSDGQLVPINAQGEQTIAYFAAQADQGGDFNSAQIPPSDVEVADNVMNSTQATAGAQSPDADSDVEQLALENRDTGLSTPVTNPQDNNNSSVSDPVDVVSGEFFEDAVDLTLSGPFPIQLRRNYSSQNPLPGVFGYGWNSNFNFDLTFTDKDTDDDQEYVYAGEMNGTVVVYEKDDTDGKWYVSTEKNPGFSNDSSRGMGANANYYAQYIEKSQTTLNRDIDGDGVDESVFVYTLYGRGGSVREFYVRSFPIVGSQTTINRERPYLGLWKDNRGNTLSFYYEEDDTRSGYGRIKKILGSNGNWLGLRYDRYLRISEAFTSDSRRVTYEYDGYGDLVKVTLPDHSEIEYEYGREDWVWKTITLPVGEYYQGDMDRVVFVCDYDTTPNPDYADGSFRNVTIYESDTGIENGVTLSFDVTLVESYGVDTSGTDVYTQTLEARDADGNVVTTDGVELYIQGNSWKSVALPSSYTVTENTLLRFEFTNSIEAEFHAIGLDDDANALDDGLQRFIWFHGTQGTGIGTIDDYYGVYRPGGYYSDHLIDRILKPEGRTLVNTYDDERRVVSQESTVGENGELLRIATYAYDHTTASPNPITGSTKVYDVFNDPAANPGANYTLYEYTDGLITKIEDTLGQEILTDWFMPGEEAKTGYFPRSIEQRTNKRGVVTNYQYDSRGNPVQVQQIGEFTGDGVLDQRTSQTVYNDQDLPVVQTGPLETPEEDRLSTVYGYHSGADQEYLPWFTLYFKGGNIDGEAIANGLLLSLDSYQYESVTDGDRFANGLLERVVSGADIYLANGSVIEYENNAWGFPVSSIAYANPTTSGGAVSADQDNDIVTTFEVNRRGEVVKVIDQSGNETRFTYDDMGRQLTEDHFFASDPVKSVASSRTYYNQNGEVSWVDGPRKEVQDYVQNIYDHAGRLSSQITWLSEASPDGSGVETAPYSEYYLGQAITQYRYDGFGNLLQTKDPNGNYSLMEYDSIGQVTRIEHYDGGTEQLMHFDEFEYEPGGEVTRTFSQGGLVAEASYNDDGALIWAKSPAGSVMKKEYYLDGRLRKEILPNKAYWLTYYNQGATGLETQKEFFDPSGKSLGVVVVEANSRGNAISQTDLEGYVSTSTYDALGRVLSASGPPAEGSDYPAQSTTYDYGNYGLTVTATNALGESVRSYSDSLGRTLKTESLDVSENVINQVEYRYDPNHQWVETISGLNESDADVQTRQRVFTDTRGQVVLSWMIEDDLEDPVAYEYAINTYDKNGNLITAQDPLRQNTNFEYDGLGRLVKSILPDDAMTELRYNDLGLVSQRIMPGGLTWNAAYDHFGRLIEEKLTNQGETSRHFTYDFYASQAAWTAGMPKTVNDVLRQQTTQMASYDAFGRPLQMDMNGATGIEGLSKLYRYDLRGNLIECSTDYENANLEDTVIERAYDGYSRLKHEETFVMSQSTGKIELAYDAAGRRLGLDHSGSSIVDYGYHADGRLATVTEKIAANNVFSFEYGANGLLLSRTNPWTTVEVLKRDLRGRVLDTSVQALGVPGITDVLNESLTWREDSKLEQYAAERYGNFAGGGAIWSETGDDARRYVYNVRGQLTSETYSTTVGQLETLHYGFDADKMGVLIAVEASDDSSVTDRWAIPNGQLDPFFRMEQESLDGLAVDIAGVAQGAANLSLSLETLSGAGGSVTSTQTINQVKFDSSDPTGAWSASLDLPSGDYRLQASAGHPASDYAQTASQDFSIGASSPYASDSFIESTYDDAGFTTQRSWLSGGSVVLTQTFTWDVRGNLLKVATRDVNGDGEDFVAVFDGAGRRVKTQQIPVVANVAQSSGVFQLESLYDPTVQFLEIGVSINDAPMIWKIYGPDLNGGYGGLQGIGGLEAIIDSQTDDITVPVGDFFGHVVAWIEVESGDDTLQWNDALLAGYGPRPGMTWKVLGDTNDAATTTNLVEAHLWRGYRLDPTGYVHMGARPYDPQSGRFLSPDPLGHEASMDLYNYANGDPINLVDPTGRGANRTKPDANSPGDPTQQSFSLIDQLLYGSPEAKADWQAAEELNANSNFTIQQAYALTSGFSAGDSSGLTVGDVLEHYGFSSDSSYAEVTEIIGGLPRQSVNVILNSLGVQPTRAGDPMQGGIIEGGFTQELADFRNNFQASNAVFKALAPDNEQWLQVTYAAYTWLGDFAFDIGTGFGLTSFAKAAATSMLRGATYADDAGRAIVQIDPGKYDYMFGNVTSGAHNTARSIENMQQLNRIGIFDNEAGRSLIKGHFFGAANDPYRITSEFSKVLPNGERAFFQTRSSFLQGPNGALQLDSTWQIMNDGVLRFNTFIPIGR